MPHGIEEIVNKLVTVPWTVQTPMQSCQFYKFENTIIDNYVMETGKRQTLSDFPPYNSDYFLYLKCVDHG